MRYGSIHTCNSNKYTRYLPNPAWRKDDYVIHNNAYSLYIENKLIRMLFDERSEIRQPAVNRIVKTSVQTDAEEVHSD